MTSDRFELGGVYWATPVFRDAPRRLVIVIGRKEGLVQFAFVDDLREAVVDPIGIFGFGCSREFCKVRGRDADYNCSCACKVDAAEAARVYASISERRA